MEKGQKSQCIAKHRACCVIMRLLPRHRFGHSLLVPHIASKSAGNTLHLCHFWAVQEVIFGGNEKPSPGRLTREDSRTTNSGKRKGSTFFLLVSSHGSWWRPESLSGLVPSVMSYVVGLETNVFDCFLVHTSYMSWSFEAETFALPILAPFAASNFTSQQSSPFNVLRIKIKRFFEHFDMRGKNEKTPHKTLNGVRKERLPPKIAEYISPLRGILSVATLRSDCQHHFLQPLTNIRKCLFVSIA